MGKYDIGVVRALFGWEAFNEEAQGVTERLGDQRASMAITWIVCVTRCEFTSGVR